MLHIAYYYSYNKIIIILTKTIITILLLSCSFKFVETFSVFKIKVLPFSPEQFALKYVFILIHTDTFQAFMVKYLTVRKMWLWLFLLYFWLRKKWQYSLFGTLATELSCFTPEDDNSMQSFTACIQSNISG